MKIETLTELTEIVVQVKVNLDALDISDIVECPHCQSRIKAIASAIIGGFVGNHLQHVMEFGSQFPLNSKSITDDEVLKEFCRVASMLNSELDRIDNQFADENLSVAPPNGMH